MATNDFLPFANGGGANVLTQAQYAALTTLLSGGYQSGVANSAQMNKTWRQSSIMAAVLGQFAADYSGNNSTDDGTTATLEANLVAAIRSATKTGVILADTGAANAYTAVNAPPLIAGTWVDGVVQQVKIAHANTGASTYAPDGLTAIPIYGLGLQPLQGGELALNGTAVLMHATIAGVNSGNPIAVLMECAGGAQQIPPATQSQHAITAAQAAGVVGSARNLAMNVSTAAATATLTADEIIVETALGGVRYCLANFSQSINLAATGAGGMDTGAAPMSGFVALYAIYNPTTQTRQLLATNATSTKQPEVYGGANMPSGYTASAFLTVVPTNASSQFNLCVVRGRRVNFSQTTLQSGNITPSTTISYGTVSTTAIPLNATRLRGSLSATTSAASQNAHLGVAPYNYGTNANAPGAVEIANNVNATTAGIAGPFEVDIGAPQQFGWYLYAASGPILYSISGSSYEL